MLECELKILHVRSLISRKPFILVARKEKGFCFDFSSRSFQSTRTRLEKLDLPKLIILLVFQGFWKNYSDISKKKNDKGGNYYKLVMNLRSKIRDFDLEKFGMTIQSSKFLCKQTFLQKLNGIFLKCSSSFLYFSFCYSISAFSFYWGVIFNNIILSIKIYSFDKLFYLIFLNCTIAFVFALISSTEVCFYL